MKKLLSYLFLLFSSYSLQAQIYTDYLGAGHSTGITVTSSDQFSTATGLKTIDGSGMNNDKMEASRFLAQATMGYDMQMVEDLAGTDYEAWIDAQYAIPATSMWNTLYTVWDEVLALHVAAGENPDDVAGPRERHVNYAWWTVNMTGEDILRLKIAYSLSQIFVVSHASNLAGHGDAMAHYYDMLINNSFGNFKNLLRDVTLHPTMGYYLSHLNNPKEDSANNVHPDENYAREIMQLFSIGLHELNLDGSEKLDASGDPIPTYDNDDIKEFAKVFTGLGGGGVDADVNYSGSPYFGMSLGLVSKTDPMAMYQNFHETSSKELLNGFIIPAGQDGMTDVEQTLDHLFNHANVGPFMAKRLIQRLVTSNPSPQYISRVAQAFNNNGNGVRGDMKAVIKAILLDPDARERAAMLTNNTGRLKEPLVRYIQIAKSLPHDNPFDRYWLNGFAISRTLEQYALDAPTVFNFYIPDYTPNGPIGDDNLVAPEFQIFNAISSIEFINRVNTWVVGLTIWFSNHGSYGDPNVDLDISGIQEMAINPEELINYLDILYTHGQLSDAMRNNIRETATQWTTGVYEYNRTRLIMYLLLISPDYGIMK